MVTVQCHRINITKEKERKYRGINQMALDAAIDPPPP